MGGVDHTERRWLGECGWWGTGVQSMQLQEIHHPYQGQAFQWWDCLEVTDPPTSDPSLEKSLFLELVGDIGLSPVSRLVSRSLF